MTDIRMTLWRDHGDAAAEIPGMLIGEREAEGHRPSTTARHLFDDGVRRADLADCVDIRGTADHEAALERLCLVRELTRLGLAAGWTLKCDEDFPVALLQHLYPPSEVVRGGGGPVRGWRHSYRYGDLFYRKGPGFVHVRDARSGRLRRFTLDKRMHLDAIDTLGLGAPAAEVSARVANGLRAQRLVAEIGPFLWWLPYRISRWPDTRG